MTALEQAWRKCERTASADCTAEPSSGVVEMRTSMDSVDIRATVPSVTVAKGWRSDGLEPIVEETAGASAHADMTANLPSFPSAAAAMLANVSRQQPTEPGQQEVKRRKLVKRPPYSETSHEGF